MQNLTREQRNERILDWREGVYQKVEVEVKRGEHHTGSYCYSFKSLDIQLGRNRIIMARKWDDQPVSFSVFRCGYNDNELERLVQKLDKMKDVDPKTIVPVTIGYEAGGSGRQMHYVAVPTLGSGKRSLQYVFI